MSPRGQDTMEKIQDFLKTKRNTKLIYGMIR